MNEKTLTALQESIAKYKTRAKAPNEYYNAYTECSLCELFHNPITSDYDQYACRCCPVFERTGQKFCKGNAPYTVLEKTMRDKRTAKMFLNEAKYLESLLPHDSK